MGLLVWQQQCRKTTYLKKGVKEITQFFKGVYAQYMLQVEKIRYRIGKSLNNNRIARSRNQEGGL